MANFKSLTSTVCGASTKLNNMLNDADAFADGLLDGLEEGLKPAADLIAEGQERFDKAEATLKGLVPKLPTLKSLGLQDEVDALKLLAGDAIAYADKFASIAAAFGNLDFEKIMEATCEADNKKIIDGKVVTFPKNVTLLDEGDEITTEETGESKESVDFLKNKQATNDQLEKDAGNINLSHMVDGDKQADTHKWLQVRQGLRSAGYSEEKINARLPQPNSGPLDPLAAQQVKAFEARATKETITG